MTVQEMRARIRAIAEEATALHARATAENRALNEEETTRFEALCTEADGLKGRIAQRERVDALAAYAASPAGRQSDPMPHHNETRHRYSLLRVYRSLLDGRVLDGLEGECSGEIAKRFGRLPKGAWIPHDIAGDPRRHSDSPEQRAAEYRTLDTTAGAGAIFTTQQGGMIEILRNRMIAAVVGATVMADMVGPFAIPRQSSASTFAWVGEGGAGTASNATIDQVGFSPKTLTGYSVLTRSLINQVSMDAEAFARNDLITGIAVSADRAGFAGSGIGSEPLGVVSHTDITNVVAAGADGDYLTWDDIVDLESLVSVGNADSGRLAYVTNAKVRGKLKKTVVDSNTAGIFIWGFSGRPGVMAGELNGYAAVVSNQIPSTLTKGLSGAVCSAVLFGNWEDLVFAFWGGVDVLPNPFALATSGGLQIHIYQDADIDIRRGESFARCVDAKTA